MVANAETCVNEPVSIGDDANPTAGVVYAWTPNDGNLSDVTSPNPIFTSSDAGTFTFTVTKTLGACTSRSPAMGLSDASVAQPTFSGMNSQVYTLTIISDRGCIVEVPVAVIVDMPVVTLSDPADECIDGADMSFTATPPGGVFTTTVPAGFTPDNAAGTALLDISAVGAGTYDVTYTFTNSRGCEAFQTVSVTINPLPTLMGGEVCIGDMITLTGSGAANATTPYVSDAPAVATVTDAGVVTGVMAGTANITYTDDNGCTISAVVTVSALSEVTLSAPATLCSTQTIDLTVNASVSPVDLQSGAVWTTSGTGSFDGVDPDGNAQTGDFLTATTYTPSAADIAAGEVILTLTSGNPADQSPARACDPGSASVTFTILKVDCGSFPWNGNEAVLPTLPGSGM